MRDGQHARLQSASPPSRTPPSCRRPHAADVSSRTAPRGLLPPPIPTFIGWPNFCVESSAIKFGETPCLRHHPQLPLRINLGLSSEDHDHIANEQEVITNDSENMGEKEDHDHIANEQKVITNDFENMGEKEDHDHIANEQEEVITTDSENIQEKLHTQEESSAITIEELEYFEPTNKLADNQTSQEVQQECTEEETMKDILTMPMQMEKPMRRHNKPKKSTDYVVTPEDYRCAIDDYSVIERIQSEPSVKKKLVSLSDTSLTKDDLIRLLNPREYAGNEVVNAYIYCISGEEALQVRSGGSMFFETSLVSKLIQDCANKPKDEIPEWIVERVKKYLEHDMLVAVEKLFKIASQQKELNSDKWKDLNVTSWSREECIKSTMQTDGSSCGLWMLNFMEYWTGDILSDIPNQTMSKFARDAGCREMLDVEQLAQLFRSWPGCIDEYHISNCDTIYLPYEIYGLYMLFVFNLQKKIVYILNRLPIQSWGEHIFKTMEIGKNLNLALKVANPGWNDDICKWECKVSDVLPKNYHGGLFGYLVFNFMHSYHNERLHYCIPTGDYLLKRRFVTHILKHELNEVVDNISPEERDVLDRIEKWTFTDLIE
ncbi:uncharacterized protein LOC104581418 isoform X2 [Brachypodium distachyon]|uniref:uncharacterized protein LOC104581418 isoform X2 n=1 Tax=Brachypodium distachyon TaxID=15368 RepID=UPI00071E1213|nr:uncharacterized protein LOC104581418 isoform X2 [Brachypodium distachyon]|eukprot:XP_014751355.1 uncharacterized protein LOC104581418 isoform X2 [Brachypodium distachyon]